MKKIIFIIAFVLVLTFVPMAYALEATEPGSPDVLALDETNESSEQLTETDSTPAQFFTWSILATYAGALAATVLITQLIKDIGFFAKIPTRLCSWIIAVIILLAATNFISGITIENATLCIINAGVISLAANGGYDLLTSITKRSSN